MNQDISSRKQVTIDVEKGKVSLGADIWIPQACSGVVVFAHGSGSSRFSPRNRHVATILNSRSEPQCA